MRPSAKFTSALRCSSGIASSSLRASSGLPEDTRLWASAMRISASSGRWRSTRRASSIARSYSPSSAWTFASRRRASMKSASSSTARSTSARACWRSFCSSSAEASRKCAWAQSARRSSARRSEATASSALPSARVELGAHEVGFGHVRVLRQHGVDDRAPLCEAFLRAFLDAHVDQQLGLAQLRGRIVRCDLDCLLRRVERTGEIPVAAAVRRQDQERLRVVRLGAGGLLDHRVGLRLVAARVVEAGERVDQIEIVLAGLDAVLQRLLRFVEALARVVVTGDALDDLAALLVLREFERLLVGGLGVGVARAVERQKAGVEQLALRARIHRRRASDRAVRRWRGRPCAGSNRRACARAPASRAGARAPSCSRLPLRRRASGARVRRPRSTWPSQRARVGLDHRLAFFERLLELFAATEQQELPERETRVEVGAVETHRLLQFPVCLLRLLVRQVRLRQTVVRLGCRSARAGARSCIRSPPRTPSPAS